MKRILATLLALALIFSLAPAAMADEPAATTTTTNTTPPASTNADSSSIPPVTDPIIPTAQPGTFAYTLSRLIERIRVLLTPDLAAKAELLAQQAQLRIAEIEQLPPAETKLADTLTKAYVSHLQRAVDYMVRAQAKGKNISKAEAKLLEAAEGGKILAAKLEGTLTDEDRDELDGEADKAALNAACIADVAPEIVKSLREQGLGYGEIALINLLVVKSGKTTDEIAALFAVKGFGAAATELGLSVSELRKSAHGFAEAVQAMDSAKVKELRRQGHSYGKIATIQMMAEVSGKPIEEVNRLVDSKGLGQVVTGMGVSMKELHAKAKQTRKSDK